MRAIAQLSDHWNQAEPYQKFAYLVGLLLIASAFFHAGVLLVTGGPMEGPTSWRKPILFGQAFGLTLVSVAWVLTFLPRRRILGWILLGGLSTANFYEVLWVSVQQWRGVPSHFNVATPFDAMVFSLAGSAIAVTAAVILAVAVWSFLRLSAPASLRWAIRFGLVSLLLSQGIGLLIIQNGVARTVDPQSGRFLSENLATAAIFGAEGSMKLPHALTLHALQVLPLLALLLSLARWTEPRRLATVVAASLGYAGLVALSLWQTFHGLAPLSLGPFALTLGLVFSGVLAGSFLYALTGLRPRAAEALA
jgi:hypothetical protein